MLSQVLLPLLFSLALSVRADPNPTEPGPGEVFKEGQTCHIAWDPDTTGTWKTMNIELMTGNNFAMVHLTTVAVNIDGTTGTGTFDYNCPAVTDHSGIYFYQFTSPSSPTKIWTTRFTIADPTGKTNPAPNATEPDGSAIPWGNGALANPASAVAAPSYLGGAPASGSPPASASTAPASSASVAPSSSAPVSTPPATSVAASTPATSGFATTRTSSIATSPTADAGNKAATNTTGSGQSSGAAPAVGASAALRGAAALAILAGTLSALL